MTEPLAAGIPASEEDRRRLRESLKNALGDVETLFREIVDTAGEKSFLRCPYMSVQRECTAQFDCINQVWKPGRPRAICSGLNKINFCCPERPAGPL